MSMKVRWLLAGIAGWLLSLPLLADASIFALMPADPATGRARGCYTEIEQFLALHRPSAWIREAELSVGVLLFVGTPLIFSVAAIRRRLASQRPGEAVAPREPAAKSIAA